MENFSVRKPLTIFVAVLAVLILGVVAFTKMTPDLLPNMDFPYVVIVTSCPGASPETVEAEVTKPLEQATSTLEHIKTVSSTSAENYSVLMLEFEDDVNMDTIGTDIQQQLTRLAGTWDSSVGSPYMLKINPSLLPVEVAAVSMEGMDTIELSDFVDDTLMTRLEGIDGVARVSTIGSVSRQIHVVIDDAMIADVNRRLQDTVSRQIGDAREELEQTKQELTEAQEALQEARSQLDSGSTALVDQTASAEAYINEQQVALLEGRMEIRTQLLSLAQSRSQLETTLGILRPVAERLSSLATRQQTAEQQRDALREAGDRLLAADEELLAAMAEELPVPEPTEAPAETAAPDTGTETDTETDTDTDTAVDANTDTAIDTDTETVSETDPPAEPEPAPAEGPDTEAADEALEHTERYIAALAEVTAAEEALEALGSSRWTWLADIASAEAELALVSTELAAVDALLGTMDLTRDGVSETIAQMEDGIDQIDAGTALLEDTLSQLDSGAIQLSEALGTLSTAKSEGLLQLAEAASQISMNAGTVDSALAQVDTGLETLDETEQDALASAEISDSISISAITSLLAAQSFSMPAGTADQDGITYMVSVGDMITDPEELKSLLLFDTGEDGIGPVYLSDVAAVFVTDDADSTYARLDGETGLILTFEKQSNAATVEVTDNISDRFRSLEAEHAGLRFVSLMDQGTYIRIIIRTILQSLLFGAVFAVIVLFVFLRDIRPTVITLAAIPISVVFAFVLMYFSGITLNMISLSGLAVSVGMLVDNSIVVIENIYRMRARGAAPAQAAAAGTRQVSGAIVASTLTTICVFLPIVFVDGLTRELFTDLALTMSFSLSASLVIALTLVPAMARGMLKGQPRFADYGTEGRLRRGYRGLLSWSLRHKWIVLPLAAVLLAGSTAAALSRGFSYMPETDMNTVSITIGMPEGTTREEAAALADEALERMAAGLPNAETIGAMMGGISLLSTSESYDITVYITLPEGDSGAEAGAAAAALCADMPVEIRYDSALMSASMLTGSGVEIRLFGNDMEPLQQAAEQIGLALEAVPGLTLVDNGLSEAETSLHITVDRNAAMEKGYTVAQLYAQAAAALLSSSSSITLDMEGISADVIVSTGGALTPEELMALSLPFTNADGKTDHFLLSEVASLQETRSLSTIQRLDQRRTLSVTAQVAEGGNVTLLTEEAEKTVAALDLPQGVTWESAGESEQIMESVRQLVLMLLLGVVLVYFIMVAQFQSLLSPFIVMFTIPLAFTGGFLALLLCGLDVSVLSLIGFVMLTGIIVNNGIVLIDCVNQLRAAGKERRSALVEAGVTRLRPILMTSLTTVLGLIVMAFGKDPGTAMMQPVAIVCIGGLLYATLMTLIVVPCIYDLLNKKEITVLQDEDLTFEET